jgi:hypothetical protein
VAPSYADAFGAEPQVAISVFIERTEPVRIDSGGIAFIEDRETHALEAGQAIKCGQPEIPVRGLTGTANDVLRQTVVRRPNIEPVLRTGRGTEAKTGQQPQSTERIAGGFATHRR